MSRGAILLVFAALLLVPSQASAKSACGERKCASQQTGAKASSARTAVRKARHKRVKPARVRAGSANVARTRKAPRFSRRAIRQVSRRPNDQQRATQAPIAVPAVGPTAERRFRAFIHPMPMAENQFETWRRPRIQLADLSASGIGQAALLMQYDPSDVPVLETVSEPVVAATEAKEEPLAETIQPSASLGQPANRGEDSGFLRSLVLALGGAATLASVLRLVLGA